MCTLLVAVRLLKERERPRIDGEEGVRGVQSVHVDSGRKDYIPRAPSGGLFGDTLVREVTVLERDRNPKYDEKTTE